MIKSADVDKGGGGKTLIHKMWIKNMFFFLNPSLSMFMHSENITLFVPLYIEVCHIKVNVSLELY